jgi:hypothetical protein
MNISWQIVFYEPRPFAPEDFKTYVLEQAKPYQDTIDLVKRLKAVYQLRLTILFTFWHQLRAKLILR